MSMLRCIVGLLFASVTVNALATNPIATLRPEHPRLLLTNEQLALNIAAAKSDPLRAELHRYIIRTAEAHFTERPIEHVVAGNRLLDQSRKAIEHVLTSAMAYRLTGDDRFARFAIDQML